MLGIPWALSVHPEHRAWSKHPNMPYPPPTKERKILFHGDCILSTTQHIIKETSTHLSHSSTDTVKENIQSTVWSKYLQNTYVGKQWFPQEAASWTLGEICTSHRRQQVSIWGTERIRYLSCAKSKNEEAQSSTSPERSRSRHNQGVKGLALNLLNSDLSQPKQRHQRQGAGKKVHVTNVENSVECPKEGTARASQGPRPHLQESAQRTANSRKESSSTNVHSQHPWTVCTSILCCLSWGYGGRGWVGNW